METRSLTEKRCIPCDGDVPRLDAAAIEALLPQVAGWRLLDGGGKLARLFRFDDFKQAIAFVNRIAELAESEGHHPDFTVRYSAVDIVVYTHAIGGLSENDFILAAKISALA